MCSCRRPICYCTVARLHQLAEVLEAHRRTGSRQFPVSQFEAAAHAIVTGDVATLKRLLGENPQLIRARSTREHRATLLHYVSANSVEGYRQKTPKNVVKVAEILLQAGAEVDAEAQVTAVEQPLSGWPQRASTPSRPAFKAG